ncbi:TonB-dependent receptor [Flavobacterium sp. CS20]|uniref:TonB-dependent receptor n=1 Tax=Flavobacterium sp. CS20 TaxID=2775246 RepID=UPI001B3A66A5|nr:TonB-dependent receptor [Flavobacterium sp. CS20]QTY27251.1 TonB-dependent receptor [Flavobacterium sp. CS20]
MNKINFISFLFFIIFSSANAQDCNLSLKGYVIDLHDNSVLENAVVKIKNINQYVLTNNKGFYQLDDLCPGEYELTVSHVQCQTQTKEVVLNENKTINFSLEHHLESLNEVLIKGELYNSKDKSAISAQISHETIDQFSNATLGDAISTLPGVSSLNTGNTIVKPVIQGLHSSRVLIINNNVRMEDQQWGVDHAPNIDINSAANITVIKGSSALEYGGDAIGGVIIAEPQKAPVKDTLMGKTILTGASNGRGGNVSTNLLKAYKNGLYFKAQGSFKRMGNLETPDYILSNTGMKEQNFALGFGLNKINYGFDAFYSRFDTEIGILRASHIGNVGDLVNAINSQEPSFTDDFTYNINEPKQDVVHQLFKVNAFKKFKNFGQLDIQYAYQNNRRKEFDVRRGNRSGIPALDLELQTHNLITKLKYDRSDNFSSKIGVELTYQDNFPNPDTGVRRLIPDYEMYKIAGFWTANYQASDDLFFNAGVRYDFTNIDAQKFYRLSRWEERNYQADFADIIVQDFGSQLLTNPNFDYHNVSANLGMQYNFNNWEWNTNIGTASRAPNPSELFSDGLHHSIANIEVGDLRIDSEQSYKISTQIKRKFNNWQFDVSTYYNFIDDYILLEPNGIEQTIRGAFPVFEYRQTNARLFGVDVNVDYQFNNDLSLNSNFAYVNGKDTSRNRALINMPPANWQNSINYHIQKWHNLNLYLSSQLVFEQTRFPDDNFTTPILNTETGDFEQTLVNISQPPEAYHLMNFRAEMPFQLSFAELQIALSVHNIFDTNYRSYLNRQRFYADEIGRNFVLQLKLNY